MRSPSWTWIWLLGLSPKLRASRSLSEYPYPLTPVYRVAFLQSDGQFPVTSGKLVISLRDIVRLPPLSVALSAVTSDTLNCVAKPLCVTPVGQADCPTVWACATVAVSVRAATTTAARAAVRRSRGGGGGGTVSSGSWCLSLCRVCQVATRPTRQIDQWGEGTASGAGWQARNPARVWFSYGGSLFLQ